MKHEEIRHKLSEYIDGSIAPVEKTAIEEHLKTCTACSDALAELRKTIEAVKQIEEVEAPAWMTQKIMAKVRAEQERSSGVLGRFLHALAFGRAIRVAAVLFLTVTAYYIYISMNPAEKYGEAPVGRLAKQDEPAEVRNEVKRRAPERKEMPEKKVEQEQGYKSLDMKYSYEKPAEPVPLRQPAAPAASAPAKQEAVSSAAERDSADQLEKRQFAARAKAPTPSAMAEQGESKAAKPRTALSQNMPDANLVETVEDVRIVQACKRESSFIGECFIIHGRLGLSNGTPSVRIWAIGTNRLLGVSSITNTLYLQQIPDQHPRTLKENLAWDKDIYGDFKVCPLTRYQPEEMQSVCVESATNLRIKTK